MHDYHANICMISKSCKAFNSLVLRPFGGRKEVITGASKAENREEFEFYIRKVLTTSKLDGNKRKRVSRTKRSDIFFFDVGK